MADLARRGLQRVGKEWICVLNNAGYCPGVLRDAFSGNLAKKTGHPVLMWERSGLENGAVYFAVCSEERRRQNENTLRVNRALTRSRGDPKGELYRDRSHGSAGDNVLDCQDTTLSRPCRKEVERFTVDLPSSCGVQLAGCDSLCDFHV